MRKAEIEAAALRYINVCRKIMGYGPTTWDTVASCDKVSALLVARAVLRK